ncbi:hypothetical protein [Acinetobacter celticus]|uniref:Uncharacterized protein n=1 Tax=Acinetobacter celticus TaxID=1891224 RepID=A0A1C3CUL1_9GAMM|nr:hypothetical protein [Acinetobacter celticus]ODA12423.1 hypothetical protein BBP83_11070 [Acinetobacter celticus]
MNIALAIKHWKFIVMAVLAIALAFSVTSCASKSHQIDLLGSQKTLAETQRDLIASQHANEVHEVEQAWSQDLLESERNANKNLQVAMVAASNSALAVDRLSKQVSDSDQRLSTGSHEAVIEYGKTCNFVLKTMAERGGTIAAAADQHAIDAERLDQAWPEQVKPDKPS